MSFPEITRSLPASETFAFRYSVCTLVTDPGEYRRMVASFEAAGFTTSLCEFLYCDNSAFNRMDAFQAYNAFLREARGQYVILCHQDIELRFDRREDLERVIADMDARDPAWAVLGNAGGVALGRTAMTITHADGKQHHSRDLPIKVQSLDENFLLVRAAARLGLSRDLTGFHFYGTDLCQVANFLGYTAWVVDFHLFHKSQGDLGVGFVEMYRRISGKYADALPAGFIQTTCIAIPTGRWSWRVGRGISMRLRSLRDRTDESALVERGLLRSKLGRAGCVFFGIVYAAAVPFCNLRRSFGRRRAMFLELRALEKHGSPNGHGPERARELRRHLGTTGWILQWAVYRMLAPVHNFRRWRARTGKPERVADQELRGKTLRTAAENASGE